MSQEIAKTTVEANRNKMLETLNSLNEDFNKLIENGLYKTESERATFKKKELDYYINEKNLEQATDKRTLSQLGSNLATNLSFERWEEIFKDPVMTAAMIDRLTHKSFIVNMNGNSYRLKETKLWLSEQ